MNCFIVLAVTCMLPLTSSGMPSLRQNRSCLFNTHCGANAVCTLDWQCKCQLGYRAKDLLDPNIYDGSFCQKNYCIFEQDCLLEHNNTTCTGGLCLCKRGYRQTSDKLNCALETNLTTSNKLVEKLKVPIELKRNHSVAAVPVTNQDGKSITEHSGTNTAALEILLIFILVGFFGGFCILALFYALYCCYVKVLKRVHLFNMTNKSYSGVNYGPLEAQLKLNAHLIEKTYPASLRYSHFVRQQKQASQ